MQGHLRRERSGSEPQALKASLHSEKDEEMLLERLGKSPWPWQVPPREWVLNVDVSNGKRNLFKEL